ncbi:MAG: hypothetical protein ABI134_31715 [Byssovorax sp.]
MSRTGLPIAALFLAACAGPPPPAPKTTIVLSPPIDSSSASPVAEADAAPPAPPAPLEPPLVALPEPAACVMTTSRWRGARATTDLRFREGGPIFARATGGKARLHLPVGSVTDGAGLEVADESFALRGHLASSEIWLHPSKPIVLGEAVIPLYGSKLEWARARPGVVAVTFDPQEGIALVQPLAADLPCDSLSIDNTVIPPDAALPGSSKKGKQALLRAGRTISLSLTAGGAALANLTAKAGADALVTVMETAGKNTRVSWQRERSLIFGWIPTSELEFPKQLPPLNGYGTGSGGGFGRSIHPLSRVVCPEDVPFVVEADGERMTGGKIFAGVTINVMAREGELRKVVIRSGALQIMGSGMLVHAPRLESCPLAPP